MKVTVGNHVFHLSSFRVGMMRYFGISDLRKLMKHESLDKIRDWMPEDFAENLAKDILPSSIPDGSVFVLDEYGKVIGADSQNLPDEHHFVRGSVLHDASIACSNFFSLTDSKAFDPSSLQEFKLRYNY